MSAEPLGWRSANNWRVDERCPVFDVGGRELFGECL